MTNPHNASQQPQRPPSGHPASGPSWPPPTNGQPWTVPTPPPPPRNRLGAILIVIAVVGLIVGAVTTAIILTVHRDSTTAGTPRPAGPAAPTLTGTASPSESTAGPSGTGRATAPGAPTGTEYGREQPAVGACVDTTRNSSGGVVLYRADCAAPNTPLVLDRIVAASEKCEPRGYASLRGFDSRVMCFAWNVRQGDCLSLEGPRKAPCSAGSPPTNGTVTVTEVVGGGTDGSSCPDPNRWLQAGHGPNRGIACYMPTSMAGTGKPATSTR